MQINEEIYNLGTRETLDQFINGNIIEKIVLSFSTPFYGTRWKIFEERHLVPNIRNCFDVIYNKVVNIINRNKSQHYYKININNEDFRNIICFFLNANIIVDLWLINNLSENEIEVDGNYSATRDNKINNDKLETCAITINIKTDRSHLEQLLASIVYHEFTHAYEDYQSMLKTNGEKSLYKHGELSMYGRNKFQGQIEKPISDYLSFIFYAISKIEQNSFIAQGIKEINNYKKVHNTAYKTEQPIDIIEKLPSFRNYLNVIGYVNKLSEYAVDRKTQDKILNIVNFNNGAMKNMDVNGNIKTYCFNNFRQLIKFILKRNDFLMRRYVSAVEKELLINKIREQSTIYIH